MKPRCLQNVVGTALLPVSGSPIQALVFSMQGAEGEGRGRRTMEAGSRLCPWPRIVPGQKLRGPQWGLVDAWPGY